MAEDSHQTRPEVVFDGDCGICREWVNYWHALTGDRIAYRPYQEAAADHPDTAETEFQGALQYFDTAGRRYSGAAATFKIYSTLPFWSVLDWLYQRFRPFRAVSEAGYRFFAQRRGLLAVLTHFARGRNFEPARFELTRWIFLRALGFIYLAAMASFAVQARLLIGSTGILPLASYLAALRKALGPSYWYDVPMLFWLNDSDTIIQWLPVAGCVLALAVIANIMTRFALILLFVIYLSLFYAGQTFMTFQWDLELLEAGMLAILLTPGSIIAPWLYRWLVFRFMLLSGLVKLLSGDATWRNLTSLYYHFETQPLPTPVAWYAHQLPHTLLKVGAAGTLLVELVLPFFVFAPRRLRMAAGACFIVFQAIIVVTGNYNFFNLLTIALCLFLFDDAALRPNLPALLVRLGTRRTRATHPAAILAVRLAALVILFSSSEMLVRALDDASGEYSWLTRAIAPCACVNNYGPFAVMTTERHEIVIEGSMDGNTWKEYDFKYKPGDVSKAPTWVVPHQPRVDWQMWFAALGPPTQSPWFTNLLVRILDGSQPVHALFRVDPFPDAPPRYVRAQYYRYRFTPFHERRETGDWWTRELIGTYFPPIALRASGDKN